MPPTYPGPATTVLVTILLACGAAAGNPEPNPHAAPAWRAAFDAVYRLDPGEDARFVPAPFMPERGNYYREVSNVGNPALSMKGQFTFFWTEDGKLERWSFSAGDGTVSGALINCGVESWQIEPAGRGAADVLRLPLAGDWIVRKRAPVDRRVRAVEAVVRDRLKRQVRIRRQQVDRDVVVASGTLDRKPEAGAAPVPVNDVYVSARERVGENGGGSGTPADLLESMGGLSRRRIVNETEPEAPAQEKPRRVRWSYDLTAGRAADDPKLFAEMLAEVERQTGLRFRPERRPTDVYVIAEDNAG